VEITIIATHRVFLGIRRLKNFENPLIFAEVMIKKQSGCFFGTLCINYCMCNIVYDTTKLKLLWQFFSQHRLNASVMHPVPRSACMENNRLWQLSLLTWRFG